MPSSGILSIHTPVKKSDSLVCNYSVGSERFESTYTFPELTDVKDPAFNKLCEWLAVVTSLGLFSVDYFQEIRIDFELSSQEVEFFEKLIFLGLGEFRYANKIPIHAATTFLGEHGEYMAKPYKKRPKRPLKPLLLNGGGKDGSVSAFLLNTSGIEFTWFNRGNSTAQKNVVKVWGAPSLTVSRHLDPKRQNRKYSGHRPMSAGIAFVALLAAHAYGYTDVIASNESSANEGNFEVNGFKINHQYSKSLEFESDLQTLLQLFGIQERYFSMLRPLNELQIAVITKGLRAEQLLAVTSCNNGTGQGRWCFNCAKCAFVILAISAVNPVMANRMWGEGAINGVGIKKHLEQLLNPAVDKPLECVGTLEECQIAAHIVLQNSTTRLNPETKELLERFAKQPGENYIKTVGDSTIPKDYMGVVELMKRTLDTYAAK